MKTFSWDIWLYCNYDCKFCVTKTNVLPEKIFNVDEIVDAWTQIYSKYGRCKIYITGGEPLLYPNIGLIIKNLLCFHDLHITTNLSVDISFLSDKNIDRGKIFFNITFHPYYTDIKTFVYKLLQLQEYKYDFSICYMSDKFQMSEILNYNRIFRKYGFDLVPINYDNDNKSVKILNYFLYNDLIKLDYNVTDNFLKKKLCNAGVEYACVDRDGNAFSCNVLRYKIGNIFNDSFSFLDKTTICNKECKLYENKY